MTHRFRLHGGRDPGSNFCRGSVAVLGTIQQNSTSMRLIGMPSHLHLAKADWLDDTRQLVSVATRNVVPPVHFMATKHGHIGYLNACSMFFVCNIPFYWSKTCCAHFYFLRCLMYNITC